MKLLLASATSLIALLTFDTGSASAAPFLLPQGYAFIVTDLHPGVGGSGHAGGSADASQPVEPIPFRFMTEPMARALTASEPLADRVMGLIVRPAATAPISHTTASNAGAGNSSPNGRITSSLATGVTFLDRDPVAVSAADPGTSTLSSTYIPLSGEPLIDASPARARADGRDAGAEEGPIVETPLSAAIVASDEASPFNGTTPTSASTVSLGTLGRASARRGYMALKSARTDATSDPWTPGGPTSQDIASAAGDPCAFTIAVPGGTTAAQAATANLGILVTGKGVGRGDDILTVYTDDSMAYGGTGDAFAYVMTRTPEPSAIATIGSSLGGLAFIRRRSRQRATAR